MWSGARENPNHRGDLVHQGKIRYIGSSSFSGSQIVEAQWASRDRNLERFVTEQPPYSILVRGMEEDVLPTTMRFGMGTLTYSPLAGGWLSGRWRKDAAAAPTSSARPSARFDMSRPANQRKLDIVDEFAQLAEANGITINPDDNSYGAHELIPVARRR